MHRPTVIAAADEFNQAKVTKPLNLLSQLLTHEPVSWKPRGHQWPTS
jgi:hypothetical protein